jgi:formiminotetrahydrofolate cyclodeaminase
MNVVAPDLLEGSLRRFMEDVSSEARGPAGGSVAAVVVGLAAALVAMTARASRDCWSGAPGAIAQADALTARVAPLAQADADAYADAIVALHLDRDALDVSARDSLLASTLARAADVPLAIAEIAADVGLLAAEASEHCDPDTRPEALAACLLAEAAGRTAAHLVETNLATTKGDELLAAAHEIERQLADARARVDLAPR